MHAFNGISDIKSTWVEQRQANKANMASGAQSAAAAVAALIQNRAKAALEGQQEIVRLRLVEQHRALEEVCFLPCGYGPKSV